MICLKVLIFAVAAGCVLARGMLEDDEDQDRHTWNCTETFDANTNECRSAHLDTLLNEESVKEIESAEVMLNPFIIWDTPELCSNLEELADHVYCMFYIKKECAFNTSLEDYYPYPSVMKKAVMYLCEQKAIVFEKLNQTDVQSCLEKVKVDATNCMNNYIIVDESSMLNDACVQVEQYKGCMARFNECTGDVSTVFESYAEMLRPKTCAACAFTAGLTIIMLAAFATVLFQE